MFAMCTLLQGNELARISSGVASSTKLVETRGLGESEVYERLAGFCN